MLAIFRNKEKGFLVLTDCKKGKIIPNKHGMVKLISSESFEKINAEHFNEYFEKYTGKKTVTDVKNFIKKKNKERRQNANSVQY